MCGVSGRMPVHGRGSLVEHAYYLVVGCMLLCVNVAFFVVFVLLFFYVFILYVFFIFLMINELLALLHLSLHLADTPSKVCCMLGTTQRGRSRSWRFLDGSKGHLCSSKHI